MTKPYLSIARLHEVLTYNPATGLLTWKVSPVNSVKVGDVAGSLNKDGYVKIQVDGYHTGAHRVIFAMQTGRWPNGEVDHEDRDRGNNRWLNLREATESQNQANAALAKHSTVGLKGVTRFRGSFRARIAFRGQRLFIGDYDTPELAHAAYMAKAKELFGEFARAA